jgi:hypothetical protein
MEPRMAKTRRLMTLSLGLAGALALTTHAPPQAKACGGFFCSQVPVDQTGEQIIFGVGEGTITAQILINYAGEAEDFAWVLPVASKPEITLGSPTAFQRLDQRTAPVFNLDWNTNNECNNWWWWFSPMAADASAGNDEDGGRGVTVIAEKEVGPFQTVILESTSTDELIAWLDDNDYDQPPETRPLIDHYVRQGMLFVALRLLKDEPTGAIQPITLTFEEPNPCVPLVLTQVAASPDMPVQLYLVSDKRMVPTNWMHVTINEKKIDWINRGANYDDVVTQAVDEAAGHAFVTEYAGPSAFLKDLVYRDGQYDIAKLATLDDPAAFIDELMRQNFPRDPSVIAQLRKHIPMPAHLVSQGVSEAQFYNNLAFYADQLGEDFVFDPAALAHDLDERIVTPLKDTQAIFDSRPYFSRLYTTVSPEEMTRDPIFAENPDLPDVSNVHTATATATCGVNPNDPPESVLITLPSGKTMLVRGPFQMTWPTITYPDPAPNEPAASKIELIGTSGPGTVVHPSQVTAVDQALDLKSPSDVVSDLTSGVIPRPVESPRTSGGCGGANALGGLAMALGGLTLMMRSRSTT